MIPFSNAELKTNLVEESENLLSALVDRENRGEVRDVRRDAERSRVLDGRAGVETPRRVVVARNLGAGGHHLRDGDTLALATRYSADLRRRAQQPLDVKTLYDKDSRCRFRP